MFERAARAKIDGHKQHKPAFGAHRTGFQGNKIQFGYKYGKSP